MKRSIPTLFIFILLFNSFIVSAQKKSKQKSKAKEKIETATTRIDPAILKAQKQQFWDSIPDPIGLTTDFEKIFTPEQCKYLDSMMIDFEKKTTIEFSVVTLDTMHINEDRFDDLPKYISNAWGIGKVGKDNGVVMCISLGYRRVKIYAGLGVDEYIGEPEINSIVNRNIFPLFKKGQFFQGTLAGLTIMMNTISSRIR
ncbi:hypothetical protein BH09BAC2_BH09BAC2_11130 [soil metagenome]